MAHVESGLNPSAGADSSSAKGLFQFINGTWKQYGNGGNVLDPVANADAGARYLKDNMARLGTTDPGAAYLAHFAGPGGAKAVMSADPSASALSVLGPDVVAANPFLRNMTAADVQNWAARKMGTAGVALNSGASVPSAQTSPGVTANSPSPSAASPFSLAGSGGAPATPAPDDGLGALAAIQALSQHADPNKFASAAPQQTINYPTPPGLARARALAAAMQSRRLT